MVRDVLVMPLMPGPKTFRYEFGKHTITFEAEELDDAFKLLTALKDALNESPTLGVTAPPYSEDKS